MELLLLGALLGFGRALAVIKRDFNTQNKKG
jgi:hypothetical protein